MLGGDIVGTISVVSLRVDDLLTYERPLLQRGEVVVGLDEVGRAHWPAP